MTSVSSDGVVEFRFYRPQVCRVAVVGDFNAWRRDALLMESKGDGWWSAQTHLGHGDYRFRYLADGTWYTDYASNGIEHSKFGCNSVLVVPAIGDQPAREAA